MDKHRLFAFEELKILLQYMFLGGEISVKNCINVPLTFRTDSETLEFCVRNENFPEFGFRPFTEKMTIPYLFDMIQFLKSQPAEKMDSFSSRWEEIKTWTTIQTSLNRVNFKNEEGTYESGMEQRRLPE